jgi:competence protein ComEC
VLRVSAGSHSALLTGDIEALAEERLVQTYGNRLDSDVLVVPHHGSDSSSTAAFIDRVSPAYALVSAGYLNRYGFPASTVLQRYRNASVTVLNTADAGSISLCLGVPSGTLRAELYRSQYRRYWHWRP